MNVHNIQEDKNYENKFYTLQYHIKYNNNFSKKINPIPKYEEEIANQINGSITWHKNEVLYS